MVQMEIFARRPISPSASSHWQKFLSFSCVEDYIADMATSTTLVKILSLENFQLYGIIMIECASVKVGPIPPFVTGTVAH